MLSHEQIWKAIDRLAESHGYSTSGLAKRAGLDPTTLNRSKRFSNEGKERWPSTESISRILAITKATLTDFVALVDDGSTTHHSAATIPLLPLNKAGQAGHFDDAGAPHGKDWGNYTLPTDLMGRQNGVYALEITVDSLNPVYRSGDVVIISPSIAIKRGDRVVVRTHKGTILIREVVKQPAGKIDLKTLTNDGDVTSLNAEDVTWMARIIWVSQ